MTTIKNVSEEKKELKSLIRFHSASKVNNYNREGGGESKRIYGTSEGIRITTAFLVSLLSESSPSLGDTAHLTSLGCLPVLC